MRYKYEKNRSGEENGKRKRIRAVAESTDFMRVEDVGHNSGLDPFELEVKNEMAALSRSPADELSDCEVAASERTSSRNVHRGMRSFIRNVGMTRQQRLMYELCYVSNLSNQEVGYLLRVSHVTVSRFRRIIYLIVERASRKRRELRQKARSVRLTRRQTRLFGLFFNERLSVAEIAVRTGKGRRNVEKMLQKVRKKIFCL
jgi:hypothetical protein